MSAKRSSSQGQELGHKSSTLLFSKLISRIPSPLSERVINSKQDIRNTSHFPYQRIGVKTLGSHLEFTAEAINQVFPRSSISFLKFSNQFFNSVSSENSLKFIVSSPKFQLALWILESLIPMQTCISSNSHSKFH